MFTDHTDHSIFIIAGEESGDLHGSHLVQEMLKLYPNIKFIGHGGNKMAAAGVEIVEHISALSVLGFTEVLKHLPYMFNVMSKTIEILIDQIKKLEYIFKAEVFLQEEKEMILRGAETAPSTVGWPSDSCEPSL